MYAIATALVALGCAPRTSSAASTAVSAARNAVTQSAGPKGTFR